MTVTACCPTIEIEGNNKPILAIVNGERQYVPSKHGGVYKHNGTLNGRDYWIQVNLCQMHLFWHQLTHIVTKDCLLNYKFSTWKLHAQNMGRTCCVHKLFLFLFWHSEQFMYTTCSDLGIFMYWTCNSMNNLLSNCGLVDARMSVLKKIYLYRSDFNCRKFP